MPNIEHEPLGMKKKKKREGSEPNVDFVHAGRRACGAIWSLRLERTHTLAAWWKVHGLRLDTLMDVCGHVCTDMCAHYTVTVQCLHTSDCALSTHCRYATKNTLAVCTPAIHMPQGRLEVAAKVDGVRELAELHEGDRLA